MNDALLSTLKTIGAIIAALYGVYATVTDFKVEKDGRKKLSRAGWLGLSILLIATILNLSTDFFSRRKDAHQHTEDEKARQQQETSITGIGDSLSRELAQTVALNQGLTKTSRAIEGNVVISQNNARVSSENLAQTQRLLDPIMPTMHASMTLRIPRQQQAVEAFGRRIDLDKVDLNSPEINRLILEGSDDWPSKDDVEEHVLFSFLHEIRFALSFRSRSTPPRKYNLEFSGSCGTLDDSVSDNFAGLVALRIFPNRDLQVDCALTLQSISGDPALKSYRDLLDKTVEVGFENNSGTSLAQLIAGRQLQIPVFSIDSLTLTTPDGRMIDLQGFKAHDCSFYISCATSLPITSMSFQRNEFSTALQKALEARKRHRRQ